MTDKELLELAAKAAGIDTTNLCQLINTRTRELSGWVGFNPLTDDGDALRLAVKLGFMPTVDQILAIKCSDPYAATRRAIVRAAAAIGKEMK